MNVIVRSIIIKFYIPDGLSFNLMAGGVKAVAFPTIYTNPSGFQLHSGDSVLNQFIYY